MKGLQERRNSSGIFLVVKHHSIVQESKQERDGFEPIPVENPRTHEKIVKYIKRYKGVEALVNNIEWYDTEEKYERRFRGWKLYLDAAGVACVLDIPFDSRQASRFMKLAENLDFSKPVEFTAWYDKKSDSTAFNVKQGDKSVPQKYTREEPGECPEAKQRFGGKWDYSEQEEFLYNQMINVVIPRVRAAANARNGKGQFDPTPPPDLDPADDPEYPYVDDEPSF